MITAQTLRRSRFLLPLVLCAAGAAQADAAQSVTAPDAARVPAARSAATADAAPQATAARLGRSGLPLPRFVSLRAREVNMRTGPGIRYPIDWVYRRPGLPLEVIDEFEHWRRVRDWEGSVGWVHKSMLSGARSVIVIGDGAAMRRASDTSAPVVARLDAGVIGTLDGCREGWCQIRVQGIEGWLPRAFVFGAAP